MEDLRLALLVILVPAVGALAAWELRRGRRRGAVADNGPADARRGAPAPREMLDLPELRAREPAPTGELPVFEIAADAPLAPEQGGLAIRAELARDLAPQTAQRDSASTAAALAASAAEAHSEPEAASARPQEHAYADREAEPDDADGDPAEVMEDDNRTLPQESPWEEPVAARPPPASAVRAAPARPPEPVVALPEEDERRIIAVRLVAAGPDRLSGRLIRQALGGEGFVPGALDIFHKATADGRAYLSAASLTRPGSFDLELMDTQRFGGLSLFAVLPGPLSPEDALEELLASARRLNERLQGALQDERGGPLTPVRIAQLRESVASGTADP